MAGARTAVLCRHAQLLLERRSQLGFEDGSAASTAADLEHCRNVVPFLAGSEGNFGNTTPIMSLQNPFPIPY